MKKLCALVLALVMTLGLATVSTNAAFEGESFNFNEAVDVMAAVGVFKGDENGKFNPTNSLDRASAAKLIAYLDLGEKTAEALPQAQMFSDVPANHWASKYIAYCANAGYVSGYEGKYFPAGELNGYAFGKMVLCVLGYDATIENLSGTTAWTINVAKLMEKNDIDDGIDTSASLTLTREQAAQYCLNALQATMVEYDSKGTSITINDTTIATGATAATKVADTANDAWSAAINDAQNAAAENTVQLGEKLYKGDLELKDTAGTYDTDDFGAPVATWLYKNEEVTTHNEAAVATFTAATTAADVVTALKGYKIYVDLNNTETTDTGNSYVSITKTATTYTTNTELVYLDGNDDEQPIVTINGAAAATALTVANANDSVAETIASLTANGRVVKFFADSDTDYITKIVVNTYTVAKVDSVTTKTSSGNVLVTYKLKNTGDGNTVSPKVYTTVADKDTATGDNAVVVGEIAEDSYVTYFTSAAADPSATYYVYATTTFTGAQSAITSKGVATIGGSTYSVGLGVEDDDQAVTLATLRSNDTYWVAVADFANSTDEANYYVDQFGYVVATNAVSSTTNYAVIDRIAATGTSGTAGNVGVEAILALADGTTKTVTLAKVGGIKVKNIDSTDVKVTVASSAVTAIGISGTYTENTDAFEGVIVTYTENSDGTYNLEFPNIATTQAATTNEATVKAALDSKSKEDTASGATTVMTKGSATVIGSTDTSFVGNSSTVYLVETEDSSSDWTFKTYTGYASAPTITIANGQKVTISYAENSSGSVKFVYVEVPYNVGNSIGATSTGTYAYVSDTAFSTNSTGDDVYYEMSLIVDGVAASPVKTESLTVVNSIIAADGKLIELTLDSDDYVTAIAEQDTSDWTDDFVKVDTVDDTDYAKDGVLRVQISDAVKAYSYNDDTKVYVIDDDEVVEGAAITTVATGDTVYVKVIDHNATDSDATTAEIVYIVKA